MKTAEQTRAVNRSAAVASPPTAATNGTLALPRSQKIAASHLEKLAIVYVRQSSAHQVLNHRESRERQYALAGYAVAWGWPKDRVVIIDEDQGETATTAEHRSGFHRILAEVTMGHVGLVLGIELNRLSRCNKDWHHLIELCAIFGTILADYDGVYDPNDSNDRLLPGLKGAINEFELVTMRNRLEGGRLNKAQRGDLFYRVPVGYTLSRTGEVALEPDEQARSVVKLLFEKFEELGSACGVFHWIAEHGIELPFRLHRGPRQGQLEWRLPCVATLNQLFHNPIYAGAYAYGRRRPRSHRSRAAGKPQNWGLLPSDQWRVLIRDRLPAYITWERYVEIQERMKQNNTRPDTLGTPRNGRALLSGLLVCGDCGWRMQVTYRTVDKPHYRCLRHMAEIRERTCFGLSANTLDELVSRQVLRALEPAALQLSLRAQADVRRERERLDRHWQQNLKRARYEVELAERRYRAVDPENRLVAGTLEREWEQALHRERELQEECDRRRRQTRPELTADEASRITALSSDVRALWDSPQTTNADRQSIIRCLVERVVVHVKQNDEHAEATIHWAGGYESRLQFLRPVRTYSQLRNGDQLLKQISELRKSGHSAEQTANILNAEGFSPINPRKEFNRDMVRDLLLKLGLHREQNDDSLVGAGEWWIRDLAEKLRMPWQTLREWAVRGWAHGRQTPVQKLWILWADADEISRLRKLRDSAPHGSLGKTSELTTPKPRPK